jgi:uncharacterized protein (DUF1015 family)
MAIIKPFCALRPVPEAVPLVASVPYDVVNYDEAKEHAADKMLSFLRVTRAEIELDPDVDPYSKEVYEKAKENLHRLKSAAPMVVDDKPHFYLYRLEMNGKVQTGIAAAYSVDDYDNNVILKHEKTRKVKEDDRTNHIITTGAQTGPVFLTYRGVAAINEIVDRTLSGNAPLYNFTANDGIKHTVWMISDEDVEKIIEEISKVKNLYIADGHHRAASASRARKLKMETNPDHTGSEEYNFFLAVLFPAEQLNILPYNRVIFDLNGNTIEELLDKAAEKFIINKSWQKQPSQRRSFGMYLNGSWYMLKARESILASSSLSKSVAETLDVSILQDFLLNPILGIDDPRTNKNIDFVGGIRGTQELERLVDSGKAKAAFSLYPVSVDELMKISDAGEVMPPKSTWFEPKLRDGLLTHLI